MIKQDYSDGKKHIHILSFGAGTQSTAMLLMALEGEFNGVIPDYIIFSDTGWEPESIYEWAEKVNDHIKAKYGRKIFYTNGGSIREDLIKAADNDERMASLPFFVKKDDGEQGMVMRQCTDQYKIQPVKKKVRELLGYSKGQRVGEVVHMWKGISTDEIQRVKPIGDNWIKAEHPLIDTVQMNRSNCIAYVERAGLGTPAKSSCIGCPFHDNGTWLDMKKSDPQSWADAVYMDKKIRRMPKLKGEVYLHRTCLPLDEVNLGEDQMSLDDFTNECEGFCGI